MDFDKKDGFSYLDNVPFKISSAFLPPAPVVLPAVFNLEEGLIFEEYDFSKEKQVLKDIRKRNETSACVNISKAKNSSNDTCGLDSSTKSNLKNIFPLQSDILLPKPQKNLNKVSNADNQNCSKINLSDFENDTSSPFDYMELQTLNELEELSSVFQGLNNKYNSDDNVYKERNSDSDGLGENDVANSVSKSMSFPLENNEGFEKSEKSLKCLNEDDSAGHIAKEKFPIPPLTADLAFDGRRKSLTETFTLSTMSKVPSLSSSSIDNNNIEDSFRDFVPKSALRGCKSYSDIHCLTKQNPEDFSKQERPFTPPSTVLMARGIEFINSPVHQNKKMASDSNCDNSSSTLSLPDPYNELSEEEKKTVDAISDMGFSRAQVSRSVKHLGSDEKTVVEHLCEIQVLEESGYNCLEAEAALHLHDYNQDEAKNFLDLIDQFQNLGFDKNAVKKALVQNKNDFHKTMDALLLL